MRHRHDFDYWLMPWHFRPVWASDIGRHGEPHVVAYGPRRAPSHCLWIIPGTLDLND